METPQLLIARGIRPSLHRTEVLRYLNANRTHPTVDQIYDSLSPGIPTLSRTTIYNVLKLLVSSGIVTEITIDSRQCRYDSDLSDHAHFLCKTCGELHDIDFGKLKIETNHQIHQTHIYLHGVCEKCTITN